MGLLMSPFASFHLLSIILCITALVSYSGTGEFASRRHPQQIITIDLTIVLCYPLAIAQNEATCNGMDDMIERIVLMTCDRNVACDMVNCVGSNIFGATYSLSLTLLSCRVPPGNIIV